MSDLLSDPRHAASFDPLGEAYAPMRRLVEQLASREYAGRVRAFKAMASFNLFAAPLSHGTANRDEVGIDYVPNLGIFRVCYHEWTCPGRNPSRVCQPNEVGGIIDHHVRRLLLAPRPPKPESATGVVLPGVLALVLFASMFVFMVCCGLGWAGVRTERLAFLSWGVGVVALSIFMFGTALIPSWADNRWTSRSGAMVGLPNRLILFGVGLLFGGGGLVALTVAGFGTEHPPQFAVGTFLGVAAVGGVLALLGGRRGGPDEGEAARAIQTALRNYAERHDGWFPRGEASPEASLSLLHRENPGLVTANVLRSPTVPEAVAQVRLESGELLAPGTCRWHYVEGLRSDDDPRLALFWEKTALNRTESLLYPGGCRVFFVGGGVEHVALERWEEFLAAQEWLRAGIMRCNPNESGVHI